MKLILNSRKARGFVRTKYKTATRITATELDAQKEVIPASDAGKPVFSASQLKITPPRTADDIRRSMAEGRFAEMTPDLAG